MVTVADAVKAILKSRKTTQMELADKLGTKQNNIAMFLKNNYGMKVENMLRMANACDYDVVLVDRSNPNNTYVIGEADAVQPVVMRENAMPYDPTMDAAFEAAVRRIVAEELAKAAQTRIGG